MIYIKSGDSETLTTGPIETSNHVPVDLSAATVKLLIKKNITDSDNEAVITKEENHPTSNIVGFHLSSTETAVLDVGRYVLGVRIEWGNGDAREIAREEMTITQGVFNG